MVKNNLMKYIPFSQTSNWNIKQFYNSTKINSSFDLNRIGSAIQRRKDKMVVEDDKLYKRITIKTNCGGVVVRDEVVGNAIRTKNQYYVRSGQLAVSKIDARNGAFGIIPPEADGAIITGNFWVYDVDPSVANIQYLILLFSSRSFIKTWQDCSNGSGNRLYLQEQKFLDVSIPLPSRPEQDVLVQQYLDRTGEAKKCFQIARKEENELEKYVFYSLGIKEKTYVEKTNAFQTVNFSSLYFWGCDKLTAQLPYSFENYKAYSFNNKPQLANEIFRGKSPKYADSERMILNQKCNRKNSIDIKFAKSISEKWFDSISEIYLTRADDILINSTGEGTIGRASLVTEEYEGYLYDSHMLLLRINKKIVEPELIVYLINSQFGQKQIEMHKSAQATKQTELGIENLKKIVFPLPEIDEQKKIVAYIKNKTSIITSSYIKANALNNRAKRELEEAVFGEA